MAQNDYFCVFSWMADKKRLNLTGNELCIYAIIYGFTISKGGFSGSHNYIAERLNIARRNVTANIKKLVNKGLLISKRKKRPSPEGYVAVVPDYAKENDGTDCAADGCCNTADGDESSQLMVTKHHHLPVDNSVNGDESSQLSSVSMVMNHHNIGDETSQLMVTNHHNIGDETSPLMVTNHHFNGDESSHNIKDILNINIKDNNKSYIKESTKDTAPAFAAASTPLRHGKTEKHKKAKTKTVANKTGFDPMKTLLAAGVDNQVASDWLVLRKRLKADVTETVIKTILNESKKAGINFQKALETCILHNWRGFKATWYLKEKEEDRKAGIDFESMSQLDVEIMKNIKKWRAGELNNSEDNKSGNNPNNEIGNENVIDGDFKEVKQGGLFQ